MYSNILRVNNAGDFSNGITTIQSMYATKNLEHVRRRQELQWNSKKT